MYAVAKRRLKMTQCVFCSIFLLKLSVIQKIMVTEYKTIGISQDTTSGQLRGQPIDNIVKSLKTAFF